MMKLFSLLNPQYHRFFDVRIARDVGINGAVLLQELVYKHDYWEEQSKLELDGSFFMTQEDVERDTTLSPHQQSYALKALIDKGLVKVSKHGMPPINYYLLDEGALMQYLVSNHSPVNQHSFTSESTFIQNLVNNDANFKTTNISDTKIINTKEDTIPKGIAAFDNATKNYKVILEYVNSLEFSDEIKSKIIEWLSYKAKGSYTLGQLRNNLNSVYQEVNGDMEVFELALDNAIQGGWQKLWAPKNTKVYKVKGVTVDEEDEVVTFTDFV